MLLNTCLSFMTNMLLSPPTRPLTMLFLCVNHNYIDCLIKELGIDNSLGNPTYTPITLTNEEILDNHRSVLCSFGISIKDEELDLQSYTGFLNYTSVLSHSTILLGLPNAIHETSFQIINMYSIGDQSRASELL